MSLLRTFRSQPDSIAPRDKAVITYPNPQTESEVAANRRAHLDGNPTLERSLTQGVVGIVALVTLLGAAGSIYTITGSAAGHHRSPWSGIASWAGAEGVLLAMACVSIAASWRGQLTPRWARTGMWGAALFAVALNLTAADAGLHTSTAELLLLVAPPIATAGGVETLAWNAKSTLDVRTGADQYQAIRQHRERVIRTHRWTTRAAAWRKRKWVLGPAARAQARRATEVLALDDPELIVVMQQRITAFVAADAAFGKHPEPAAAALPEVTLERVPEAPEDALPELPEAPLPEDAPAPTQALPDPRDPGLPAPPEAPEQGDDEPLPGDASHVVPPATEAPEAPSGSTPPEAPGAEAEEHAGSTLEERFREALPGMDPEGAEVLLDKVRDLFDGTLRDTGKHPSKRAVQNLIGKRWEVASVLHEWVVAERETATTT
ncbi:hypothetical protein ACFYUL_17775 [Streptomyces sp. NPDC004311]|uniref:hypothetical protein n=1 Tax=Streptomyces sp. NPDC004311 TaxID=3364698 RepID=UPI0036CEB88E